MSSFQPFLALFSSAMLQLPNLDNMQLILRAAACIGIIGVIARVCLAKSKSGFPLPPSPPTRRLSGHFLPPFRPYLAIAGWIEEYGPLITIRSRFENIVVIGRYKAAVDIMENQGKSLAGRPRMIAAGDIFRGGLSIVFEPYGERVRRMRKALHTHLQPSAAEARQPLQMSHVKDTILDILDDPYNLQSHVTTFIAATMTKFAFGKTTPTSATDPEVIEANQFARLTSEASRPDAYLVDLIPWLKYLPWYGRDLKQGFEMFMKVNMGYLNRVKEQMQSNVDINPSFAKYMLENTNLYGLTEPEVAALVGTIFPGGFNTTVVALCTVLMAAACFPEEQAEVQAELDAVIGRHRAPTFADHESLPRLHAFISEALRWRPVVPNGVAHQTTTDVIWASNDKYCIPAGTTVYGHHWSISRDPEVYPEPHAFKPQRWIDDQGRLRNDLRSFVYGFGRRACPGEYIANESIFIVLSLVLWAFRLTLDPTKPLDDMGYMNGDILNRSCTIEFETRIPETDLRRMMQNYPEIVEKP
ncbi:cytochrome P450 [Suillus ampliporus]|nr:cytochrome P450 [Suillus ampliporus]